MANLNQWVAKQQKRTLLACLMVILLVVGLGLLLIPKKTKIVDGDKSLHVTGVVDESFSQSNTESAMTAQQAEFESLKEQMQSFKQTLIQREKEERDILLSLVTQKFKEAKEELTDEKLKHTVAANPVIEKALPAIKKKAPQLHAMSFHYGDKLLKPKHALNADNYVPSGTFVRAVVLGGADADASVNGQSKNNGVMLFKLLQPGTLPNGQHSHLQGCFITGSSYGDISSERAYVVLDRLSCVMPGKPIIDKAVTGWAFFGGKVGIKGVPLMRDNKVMQWAGISGAMSGIAAAAQYSQSVQSISPLGAATTVPATNVAPYAVYGGASKAAEVLSNYYVKRAEQYHPVIQVGAGNLVTIVFKEGFFLSSDEALIEKGQSKNALPNLENTPSHEMNDFMIPPQVLDRALNH